MMMDLEDNNDQHGNNNDGVEPVEPVEPNDLAIDAVGAGNVVNGVMEQVQRADQGQDARGRYAMLLKEACLHQF